MKVPLFFCLCLERFDVRAQVSVGSARAYYF